MLEDQMVATRETEKISVANDDHSKFFILNETQERWIQKNTESWRRNSIMKKEEDIMCIF